MVEISQSRVDDVRWALATCSRHEARARAASDSSAHRWTLRVAAAALLPVTRTQCAASGHPAERCVCWRPGEDWYERCAPGAAGSVAAWRVEPRAAVRYWRALQDLVARVVERRARPVLWGGRVHRPATRLERALGYRGFVVLGDRWLRPGMGKIRWCATCGCHTPHTPSRGRWFCDATAHDLAPIAGPSAATSRGAFEPVTTRDRARAALQPAGGPAVMQRLGCPLSNGLYGPPPVTPDRETNR